MSIVAYHTTPSINYYAKRRKSDIIFSIHMMCDQLKIERPLTAELEKKTNYELAWQALRLHAQFPE
ncbi:hypothetical protein HOU00_gp299 [Caulobacter phage CcrPW]|uniref:Uncharacterized protein n=1 Tax=Caulobacter phage CcrPW TaxID=2283271 RepID=A0A385EAR7_9CAUD|nr:hypothetical protein HOU00_gp299 [Caulobacter phage CcrPW]AXQ68826.1 hypothetical protein CcrPW_gp287 [Caulobacter phage CcrPW]